MVNDKESKDLKVIRGKYKKSVKFIPKYDFSIPFLRYIVYKINGLDTEKEINEVLNVAIKLSNKKKKSTKKPYITNMNQINGLIQGDYYRIFKTEGGFLSKNTIQRESKEITLNKFYDIFFEMLFDNFKKINFYPKYNSTQIEFPSLNKKLKEEKEGFNELINTIKEEMTKKVKDLVFQSFGNFALNIIMLYPLDLKHNEYEIELTLDSLIDSYVILLGSRNNDQINKHPQWDFINYLKKDLDTIEEIPLSGLIGLCKLYVDKKNNITIN
jgi:hypothetical protein